MAGILHNIADKVKSFNQTAFETFIGSDNGLYVIKVYKPHTMKATELDWALKDHWKALHAEGLVVTKRDPLYLKSSGGQVLEIFEWKDKGSVDRAHELESLKNMWGNIKSLAELVPISTLPEARDTYATFEVFSPGEAAYLPSRVNIVVKMPHQDKEGEVIHKYRDHDKAVSKLDYRTPRTSMHMRADTGHILAICEWKSHDAIDAAQKDEKITELWNQFNNISDEVTLSALPAASERIATFQAIQV